jgi:thiol-disulfide isomerase/thioredoxin
MCFTWSLMAAGDKPVDLKMHDLSGKKVELRVFRGKPLVLNFWATWCGPCQKEMPMLVEAQKQWAGKGVTFIAVSMDDKKTLDQVPEFTKRFHVTFEVWTGGTSNDLDRLQLGQGVPDTVFIDQEGVIVARVLGEIRRNELEERLDWLTGNRKRPAPAALVNHM